jgi:hypothetical protein
MYMDFSFFKTDNKSGYKTREGWVSKNHPKLFNEIIEYCNTINLELSFKEKILFYFNKMVERPKCVTCGNKVKFRDRFDKPYGEFCSLDCINTNKDEMIKRQIKTNQEKYGVNFYPKSEDFVKKQKRTKLERYGDENFNNVDKSKKTREKKYGNSNFNNLEKYKITCINKYNVDNYSKSNSYKNKILNQFKLRYPEINILDIGKTYVTIKCDECNEESKLTKQLIYERHKRNYSCCLKCNPLGNFSRSGYQKELCDFLDEYKINYKTNYKSENLKTEIDILIPEKNIGIEFNGLYWHNELFRDENYHLTKTINSNKIGYELVHIFEDEWIYKQEIVKSILKNKLNLIENKIYGRKCEIREIDSKTSKTFLKENHIQGNVNSKVRIGLFYEEKLVSLMTFSKGRVIMGGKKDEWELNRFCNTINTNVIGGSSKLLKYFIKKHNPEKIISYSDVRIFNGGMYEKLGFIKKNQSKPNYWYVINTFRYHRFNFRKSILIKEGFDENKTEKQIMFERKIYRIYDCGNVRWELNI